MKIAAAATNAEARRFRKKLIEHVQLKTASRRRSPPRTSLVCMLMRATILRVRMLLMQVCRNFCGA